MGLGTSIFLIAVGAILRFAVTVSVAGVKLHTVGLILMVIGGIGILLSMFWILSRPRRGTIMRDDYYTG